MTAAQTAALRAEKKRPKQALSAFFTAYHAFVAKEKPVFAGD